MTVEKPFLSDFLPGGLKAWCQDRNFPAYRAGQIAGWYFQRPEARCFQDFANLPKVLREALEEDFALLSCTPEEEIEGEDGSRRNTLLLHDGLRTETVTMEMAGHSTICLSTQVGCPVQCRFCLSGRDGLKRNLSAGEIMDSLRLALPEGAKKDSLNLVIMGMGEPFFNYENLSRFLRICQSKEGFGIGSRRITVSTVGVLRGIKSFAEDFPQMNLAVSLHAPTEQLRRRIIPQAPSKVPELLRALKAYFAATKRLVTFEYTMLKGVNDTPECARDLALLLGRFPCKINLIPFNAVPGSQFQPSSSDTRRAFQEYLQERGLTATVRRSKGRSVQGACGQLARDRSQQ